MKRQQFRDYIVRVELVEFGQISYRDLRVREPNAKEAAAAARRAGYRPVIGVWRDPEPPA